LADSGLVLTGLTTALLADLAMAVSQIETASIKGLILHVPETGWLGGTRAYESHLDAASAFAACQNRQALLRRLETAVFPLAAVVEGTVCGDGLELILAAQRRFVRVDIDAQFGFPGAAAGQFPTAGGISRLVRLIGLQAGLDWLLQGKTYPVSDGAAAGLLHTVAADSGVFDTAVAWLLSHPDARAPWDGVKRYKIPGGSPQSPRIAQMLALAPAQIRSVAGEKAPYFISILAAAAEGAQVDFDTACRIEARYFAHVTQFTKTGSRS
jgi:3-hydroxyacyl-CoA dehydrogenase/enoyl-CoA hydratase/3-hydroxybutyryl-CoA epimerase